MRVLIVVMVFLILVACSTIILSDFGGLSEDEPKSLKEKVIEELAQ